MALHLEPARLPAAQNARQTRVASPEQARVFSHPRWLEEPFTTTRRWQELKDYHVKSYECTEPKWLDELDTLFEKAGLEMQQE